MKSNHWKKGVILCLFSVLAGAAPVYGKEAARKYVRLTAAIPFQNVPQEDISLVQEKVNEITEKKIGVTVDFAAAQDYDTEVNMMLSGEEQLDIMAVFNGGLMDRYADGLLLPLDEYLEQYGQGIIKEVGEEVIHCCDINHSLYGIPNNRDYACESNSYMMRKDILDKYQISPQDIRSMEDLEEVFALVKEREPELTVLLPGFGTILSNQYYLLGAFRLGVHMDYGREEELVNVFETEEYKDALRRVRRWYLKGYLDEEVLGQTQSVLERVAEGKVFAYTTKGKPNITSQDDLPEGPEMVCIRLDEASVSFNVMADLCYVIPKNTVSPEKSMELLNLLYTDADIMNLLCYGVEGVHYKKMTDGHITFADENKTNPFLNNAWSKPNQYITYVWEGSPLNSWEELKRFNQEAIWACDIGFNFDISEVETEYTILEEIYGEYRILLENGLVNPEEGINKMLGEMKENGADMVLAAQKQQFERWQSH